MIVIQEFEREFTNLLPETAALLRAGRLAVHPAVSRITLHGSRGLAGHFRPGSDIDLSLLIEPAALRASPEPDHLLRSILQETLESWNGAIELDLAAIFDEAGCGLACFELRAFDPGSCRAGGKDCFGLYKTQKGFNGYVSGFGIEVRRMYPCLVIWRNPLRGNG